MKLLHQTSVLLKLLRDETDGHLETRSFQKSGQLWDNLRTVGLSKLHLKSMRCRETQGVG